MLKEIWAQVTQKIYTTQTTQKRNFNLRKEWNHPISDGEQVRNKKEKDKIQKKRNW